MSAFGEALRALRERHQLPRQQDLAEALSGQIARSTIANLETGRQVPTARVLAALTARFPQDAEALRAIYEHEQQQRQAAAAEQPPPSRRRRAPKIEPPADYVLERYDVIYVLRDSRSPEEIIEVRHVRALSSGARDFGLSLSRDAEGFEVETEVLFGGEITGVDIQEVDGRTLIFQLLDFGRVLRKGERHGFAVRYWVGRNPGGDDDVSYVPVSSLDYRMDAVGVHVNFWGEAKPAACWAFEGLPHEAMAPGRPEDGERLQLNQHSMASVEMRRPVTGTWFGVGWRW